MKTDSIGKSIVTGVQPCIKYNLMLQSILTYYVIDALRGLSMI